MESSIATGTLERSSFGHLRTEARCGDFTPSANMSTKNAAETILMVAAEMNYFRALTFATG